jgi:hypothetical protein
LSGGLLSHFITPTPVLAQRLPPPVKMIMAQRFAVVDESGMAVGILTSSKSGNPPSIVLLDQTGKEIWRAGETALLPLTRR